MIEEGATVASIIYPPKMLPRADEPTDVFVWQPSAVYTTPEHDLCDELVVGRVERFDQDGPTYAWCCGERLGAFKTDEAARNAILEALRSPILMVKTK